MKSERGHIVFQNDIGDIQGRGLKTTDAASISPHERSCQYQQSEGDRPKVRTEAISPAQSQQRWRMYGARFRGGNGQREDSLPVVLKMEASKIKFSGITQTHSKQVTLPFKTRPTYLS